MDEAVILGGLLCCDSPFQAQWRFTFILTDVKHKVVFNLQSLNPKGFTTNTEYLEKKGKGN